MKVLMVLNDMAWFWSHRLPLARGILDRGWGLSVAAAGAARDKKMTAIGIRGLDLPDHGSALNPMTHITIIRAIAVHIKTEQPDLIHAITIRHAFYTGLAARLAKAGLVVFTIAGVGSLFTDSSLKSLLLRGPVTLLLRFAFAGPGVHIIFQNRDDCRAMLQAGIVNAAQTSVIRSSGVDLAEFPYAEEEEAAQPLVLFVSRLIKQKGIYEFVAAARELRAQGLSARFVVAGDYYPKNPHSLDSAVMESWIKEGVIEWLGQAKDMPALYSKAAMVVLPSYYGEGVPKCLLEAAATGRAIVTTDMPGCREVVKEGANGLLVPPRDAGALAGAIAFLLAKPERRRAMGREGRALMEAEFSVESVVSRTLAVYDRVTSADEERDEPATPDFIRTQ